MAGVLAEEGDILFHGVQIKPGKPFLFGKTGAMLVFGIPGYPAAALMVGQVFLAWLPAETVDAILGKYPLEQYTPYSILDRDRFRERLPLVRSEGYAMEINEVVEGLMGVAAPIFDFAGNVAGVLALGFPATRENDQAFLETTIRNLKETAAEVSANMGYVPSADGADGPGAEGAEPDSEARHTV